MTKWKVEKSNILLFEASWTDLLGKQEESVELILKFIPVNKVDFLLFTDCGDVVLIHLKQILKTGMQELVLKKS